MAEMSLPAIITVLTNKARKLAYGGLRDERYADVCDVLFTFLQEVLGVVQNAERRSRADPAVREWEHRLKDVLRKTENVLVELTEKVDREKYGPVSTFRSQTYQTPNFHSDIESQQLEPSVENRHNGVHPLAPTTIGVPTLALTSIGVPPLAPTFIGVHPLAPTTIGVHPLAPTSIGVPPLAPTTIGVPPLAPTSIGVPPLAPTIIGVPPLAPTIIRVPPLAPTINLVDSTVIGRDIDLNVTLIWVLGKAESHRVEVLPIVGMGGIGKTTLTQLVYNSEEVQNHFELKLWVSISGESHVARLAKSIIDLVIQEDSKLSLDNAELIFQRLKAELGGKKYLLVLDDVWDEDICEWKLLKDPLDCGSHGSVIIVLTCCELVASIVGTISSYSLGQLRLRQLTNEDLWEIFRLKAFGMGVEEQPNLVKIGMQLVEKCCRSPLIAKTLGGFMSYKKEEREWLDVLESKCMTVEDGMLPVLKLFYDNLSSHVKCCFAFCVVYPKNYEMERDTLIQLWMANDYISKGYMEMEMEEKGMEIFNELVWRGFFQDIKQKDNGIVCKIHYLIYDLVESLVLRKFVSSHDGDHVSCSSTEDINNLLSSSRSLRTVLLLPQQYRRDETTVPINLSKGKLVRALSLAETLIKEIHVNKEWLLSYLDLSYCNLEALPESFSTLYSLQTLKLSHCIQLKLLPKDMSHMCSLRHVYLDGCHQLEKIPQHLGKLTCLQTLTMYLVNPDIGCGIEELKDLNLGGRLELYDLSKGNIKEANLNYKRNLRQLYLSWGSVQSDLTESDKSSVVESNPDTDKDILQVLEPNRQLEVLEIRQYNGIQFPHWMNDYRALSNLTELILIECKQCEALPPISEIRSLKKLILIRLDSLKHVCSDGSPVSQGSDPALQKFANLEHLSLVDMPHLESWLENDPAEEEQRTRFLKQLEKESLDEVYEALQKFTLDDIPSMKSWTEIDAERVTSLGFPNLHELIIVRCPKLDALPSLSSCPSLRVLEIAGETNIPFSLMESFKNKGVLVK